MRFLRRYRFVLVFLALLVFCSAMVVQQIAVNQSKHRELREKLIISYSKGDRSEAERYYKQLLRDLEELPIKTLLEDYDRTLLLVTLATQQEKNFIWRYHGHVRNEIEKRSPGILLHARKLAEEEK